MIDPVLLNLPDRLYGPRVVLRPYQPGDGAALFEAIDESRDHLASTMPWIHDHRTVDDSEIAVRKGAARWLLREDLWVGIWDRSTQRMLGSSGLHRFDWKLRSFEIGYWIRASEEGKGYVTETCRVLIDFAIDHLQARRVSIQCADNNERSAAVPRRLGMDFEGTLRNGVLDSLGEPLGRMIFATTPERWRA